MNKLYNGDGSPKFVRCYVTVGRRVLERYTAVYRHPEKSKVYVYRTIGAEGPGTVQTVDLRKHGLYPGDKLVSFALLPQRVRSVVQCDYRELWGEPGNGEAG
jgi:hypothetical protein